MSILAEFAIPTMDAAKYEKSCNELENAGLGAPAGRVFHLACANADGSFVIRDVWESPEALGTFAERLIPILVKIGVTPVEPEITPVHSIIA